jgi:hypothetical protein
MSNLESQDLIFRIGVYVIGWIIDEPQGLAWVTHDATPAVAHDLIVVIPVLMSGDWPVSSAPLIGPELFHCDGCDFARRSIIERYSRIRSAVETSFTHIILPRAVPE